MSNNSPDEHTGDAAAHSDSEAPLSSPNDGEYEAPTSFAPFSEKDRPETEGRDYGAVERRAFDIQISSPADDVETLQRRTHLTAQFHEHNRSYWDQETPYDNDAGTLYNLAVLDVADRKLKHEDIDLSRLSERTNIPERLLKTFFLQRARESSGKGLQRHLKRPDPVDSAVLTEIGYEKLSQVPDYDKYQREFRSFRDSDQVDMDAFDAAVTRAVYAVYRAGIRPAAVVTEAYDFGAVEPPLDMTAVSRETEKEELREWVRILLEATIEPLTFGREDDQTKHEMQSFIGAFAASALFGSGLGDLKDVCDWNYPRENIPGGSWPQNYISGRLHTDENLSQFDSASSGDPTPTIDDQFNAVHGRTLELAKQLGFWSKSDPLDIGADMFRVDWTGDSLETTVGRPPKADNEAVTQQWTFLLAGGIDRDSRILLGGRLIEAMSDYPDKLEKILSNISRTVNIGTLLLDAETVGGDLLETATNFAGNDCIISAPSHTIIKGLVRLTPDNHMGVARNVKWNTTNRPNVVTYPTDSVVQKTIEINPRNVLTEKIRDEDDGDHIDFPYDPPAQTTLSPETDIQNLSEAFDNPSAQPGIGEEKDISAYLTYRPLPERSASGVRSDYIQRWSIEKTVSQIKNNFMAEINSSDSNIRLYSLHIAILFFNWHTIINRCLSPKGVPLHITHQQLLQAIQEVVFDPSSIE